MMFPNFGRLQDTFRAEKLFVGHLSRTKLARKGFDSKRNDGTINLKFAIKSLPKYLSLLQLSYQEFRRFLG